MVFNISANVFDTLSTVDAIKASLDMEHNYGGGTPTSAVYCEHLKGFLRAMKTSVEEEMLRYDDNSYEASVLKQIVIHIEETLKIKMKQ